MFAQECTVGREEENATVERTAFTLDHSYHQVNGVVASGLAQELEIRARHFESAFKIALVVFPSRIAARSYGGAKIEATRIAGDKCLGKQNQLCALGRRPTGEIQRLLNSTLTVESHGGSLDHCYNSFSRRSSMLFHDSIVIGSSFQLLASGLWSLPDDGHVLAKSDFIHRVRDKNIVFKTAARFPPCKKKMYQNHHR